MKAYLAGGWFTPEQERAHNDISMALVTSGVPFYNPRVEGVYDGSNGLKLFEDNVTAIHECTFMVASTVGKDMGTLFECGYAYANAMPIVYFFPSIEKFNIMLAYSGVAVVRNTSELLRLLLQYNLTGEFPELVYVGGME